MGNFSAENWILGTLIHFSQLDKSLYAFWKSIAGLSFFGIFSIREKKCFYLKKNFLVNSDAINILLLLITVGQCFTVAQPFLACIDWKTSMYYRMAWLAKIICSALHSVQILGRKQSSLFFRKKPYMRETLSGKIIMGWLLSDQFC